MTEIGPPTAWLVEHVDLIPRGGYVLDVASGRGRNALFLSARGFHVHAVDRNADALAVIDGQKCARITTQVLDLETGDVALGHRRYDAVIVFDYLHRPLLPAIVEAVAARGVLIYETFTVAQAERGHPKNPAFLLRAGELETLVAPLRIMRAREGDFDGKHVASVVAMRD